MVWCRWIVTCLLACSCGPRVGTPEDGEGDDDGATGTTTVSPGPTTVTTGAATSSTSSSPDESDDGVIIDDFGSFDDSGRCPRGDCGRPLDVLVVIDNSGSMGEEQLALARAMPKLVENLYALMETGVVTDVQVMFTTTDMDNPLCAPFQDPGYEPAKGAPTTTGCNERIEDFTGLGTNPDVVPDVCTSVCPTDLVPGDDFVWFDLMGSNVPDASPLDVDGDGVPDPPVAQALACLAPQGINGCGYEAPLEAMLQSLNPGNPWNQGETPFVREEAALAVVILSDESDCSVMDSAIMNDPAYWATNPDTGMPQPSSAICWNAGITCSGPDAQGVYDECTPDPGGNGLFPLSRYANYFADELVGTQDKPVYMLALVGVPLVTEREARPPYQPTAGGLFDLVYRDWRDPAYPAGDILPDEWVDGGIVAADKQFEFGIGPGCTEVSGDFARQAVPSPRVVEVCQSLDGLTAPVGCCIESVCEDSHQAPLRCLTGMLEAG